MTTIFRARDLTWLVALAAALWGTDAVLRLPLAQQVQAPTIVFAEHAVLVLVLLPFLPRAVRAFGKLDWRGRAAVLAIGAGASAVAVGTANFLDPRATLTVIDGIETFMREQGADDIKSLIGAVNVG